MEAGLILGRYRPLAEIGEGGHGTVDLAFDTKMARRVAIKRIPVSQRGIEILARNTGLKEARTAALLNHPNIVTVYEWDTDEDEAFLIMEHVDGASLAEILDAYAPLDLDEAASLLAQVADAVAHAHDNGVLHLDLKPENVLVTRDGLVKVGDFGVAALTNAAGQAISAGGTLGYMPPEQLRGQEVDARTDVWAFAALAFEVLTGAVPFASGTVEGALFKIERAGVPRARDFVRSLPPALDEILGEALSGDPEERPETLRQLADDLAACLGNPKTGRAALAQMAAELTTEDEPEEEAELFEHLGLWDRLAVHERLIGRIVAVVASAWLAWSGAVAIGFGQGPGAVALLFAGVAACLSPMLGIGAGIVLLAAGAFATAWPLGVAISLVGAIWWYFIARSSATAGALPVFAPLAGTLFLSPALPVVGGMFLPGPVDAAAAGAMSGLVLGVSSIAGRSASLMQVTWQMLVDPLHAPGPLHALTWAAAGRVAAITVAWGIAALLAWLGARRGTRMSALLGAAGGLVACAAAIGPWVTGGSQMSTGAMVQLGLASILVVTVVALGPPVPGTDDDADEQED